MNYHCEHPLKECKMIRFITLNNQHSTWVKRCCLFFFLIYIGNNVIISTWVYTDSDMERYQQPSFICSEVFCDGEKHNSRSRLQVSAAQWPHNG